MDLSNIRIQPAGLTGTLRLPRPTKALIVFVQGSGSSRFSPRTTLMAEAFHRRGFATLVFDLLTTAEERQPANAFDIPLLSARLAAALRWIAHEPAVACLPLGLFGAGTGAAAALVAAADGPRVGAVVSCGGRPDLAGQAIDEIRVPALLIVGGADDGILAHNRHVYARLRGRKDLRVIEGAGRWFSEPGALAEVVDHAALWFSRYLCPEMIGTQDIIPSDG
jgi:putative phosphoribosyl transferase